MIEKIINQAKESLPDLVPAFLIVNQINKKINFPKKETYKIYLKTIKNKNHYEQKNNQGLHYKYASNNKYKFKK